MWLYRPSLRKWRGMLRFGGYNGTTSFVANLYEQLPYLVLGRILSLEAVGIYNRALNLSWLPNKLLLGGVVSVVVSAFAAHVRDGYSLKASYLSALSFITVVQWPALILLAIIADPVVHVVLGPQWLKAAPIVSISALALLFSFSNNLNSPVLIAMGALRANLVRSLVIWPLSGAILCAAAFFGLRTLALSLLIVMPFQAVMSIGIVCRHLSLDWRDVIATLRKSAITAGFSAIGPLVLVAFEGFDLDISVGHALIAVVLSGIGWVAGLWLTQHPLLDEFAHAKAVFLQSPLGLWLNDRTQRALRQLVANWSK
jgi:O-antigen/teichoic acid export membrane protein